MCILYVATESSRRSTLVWEQELSFFKYPLFCFLICLILWMGGLLTHLACAVRKLISLADGVPIVNSQIS